MVLGGPAESQSREYSRRWESHSDPKAGLACWEGRVQIAPGAVSHTRVFGFFENKGAVMSSCLPHGAQCKPRWQF